MMSPTRPDVGKIMSGLKDFQRRSVDYVFERLYGKSDPVRRFLVADEVGLGKTMVARGLIARAIDHLWDGIDRIDIVYICSNGAIARQNINKLNILEDDGFALASRITLLAEQMGELSERKLNFISFTPNTSFDLQSRLGRRDERVLLYELLREPWGLKGARSINVFRGGVNAERFRGDVEWYDSDCVSPTIRTAFLSRVGKVEDRLRATYEELCGSYQTARSRPPKIIRDRRARFIGELRLMLAETSLLSLEPDLIILDEFQRFKHLLDDEDEESALAQGLFNYADTQSSAKVLLLSATPYKMYTIDSDAGVDDHCADFLATLKFLQNDPLRTERTGVLLEDIRQTMLSASANGAGQLGRLTKELESELRRVMVRTERLAVSANRDGMLTEVEVAPDLTQPDVADFLSLARIAEVVEHHEPIEFWKSAPYLLNFMDEYRLRTEFDEGCCDGAKLETLRAAIASAGNLMLNWEDVTGYSLVDPANARLRWLLSRKIGTGMWRLLWLPPSAPTRRLEGAFAEDGVRDVTKTLIFSAWKVVPKVVSALTSHAVEQRIVESASDGGERKRLEGGALRVDADRSGSTFTLLYPCLTLARLAAEESANPPHSTSLPSSADVLIALEQAISPLLARFGPGSDPGADEDESWYWLAPVLLDAMLDREATMAWLGGDELADAWGFGYDGDETDAAIKSFLTGLGDRVTRGPAALGRQPSDLASTLAKVALGSPAIAALRALAAVTGGMPALSRDRTRAAAAEVAWALRNVLNSPEATGIIRGTSRAPYWRLVLDYAIAGCLNDVLAEYAHVLVNWRGVEQESPERRLKELTETTTAALGIRAGSIRVDIHDLSATVADPRQERMRAHFATRLAVDEGDLDEEKGTERLERVSKAFNSPFWPFVVTTTSIGQEGLDFHLYCHAVAHWNLPSNPVDLEQREGRVHRFKGHAVRKNLARRHGDVAVGAGEDRWAAMFEAARVSRPSGVGDLVPYWVYTASGGSAIERHLPFLPLSRDTSRYVQLKDSLAIYRMVFGQPRQEDLLEYLRKHVPEDRLDEIRKELTIDLSPPSSEIAK
jgi:hypothetical protein